MFALVAAIFFILYAFGVRWETADLLSLGLFCVALELLVSWRPWGDVTIGRRT